ncbi:hypothetical protein [Variovorax sp. PBL-E5]|uniref:hypothetical protein n=1 Tax=Variovorax sp. PBL-E5 TaxID=434014 RepID=UPI0013A5568B|nr:hypothetical protein [Variovorax sp. PBL-E5]
MIELAYATKCCPGCGECYPPTPRFWGSNRVASDGLGFYCRSCTQIRNDKQFSKPGYGSWFNMVRRCTKPGATGWPQYGKRGIRVIAPWLDYARFIADNPGHFPGAHIDRIKGGKSWYRPGNTRWATPTENALNKAMQFPVDLGDGPEPLTALCREANRSYDTTARRIAAIEQVDPTCPRAVAFLLALEKPSTPFTEKHDTATAKRRNEFLRVTVRLDEPAIPTTTTSESK